MNIVTMNEQHLDAAYALTQRLHWPHRREDWQQALALGEGLAAMENGELIGTVLYWRWGDYATLGLVNVAGSAQGKGIGKQLMQTALAALEGHQLRLHATEMGKGLYEKLGFVVTGTIAQHQCRALAPGERVLPQASQSLRPARREELTALSKLETRAHGQHRPALIAELFASADRFLVLEEQDQTAGFACLRRFGHGFAIGPIICASLQQAKVLVSELLAGLEGAFVRIDTDSACGLGEWLVALGMVQVDEPITMYKGTPWQPQDVRAFALVSQAMA
ncbi:MULTISPECIES: GNAT family N-acetyltransferase [Erwinia]|uniref:GNAT family N-acetyltransferase n=2 Tax=Erwinia TaxID=551 RepID=A0ABV4E8C4_9GAMM|nr:GNAT family N-acetyltransferase [Erwinia sp. BC051422]MDN8542368.1 GNAT family N-acetyltransferase [Erwinia sp. BC051422]